MKKSTLEHKIQISNDIMFYIYTHIDTDINIDELAKDLQISKFYMHKIFKEIFGRNIYESIKSIRLQKASNLLLTNKYSTITEIANACGYASQTSFIRAFKSRFDMTPKEWRKGGYKEYSNAIVQQLKQKNTIDTNYATLEPEIVKMKDISAYYIRHRGYNQAIKQTWQKIQTWAYNHDLKEYQLIALLHDNPTITPLDECHYVASIVDTKKQIKTDHRLPKFIISGGVYAKFDVEGREGEFLNFLQWVYHEWLPNSDYETTTKPPFAIYKKSDYLSKDKRFALEFYLSIAY